MTNTPEQAIGYIQLAAGVLQEDRYGDMDASNVHRIESLHQLRAIIDAEIRRDVQIARDLGHSWQEVGSAMDMSKQAAQQRFGN